MPIALYALFAAAFAIGTAEFVIAGILPAVAGDLGISIPTAGLLVSIYALGWPWVARCWRSLPAASRASACW